MADIQIQLNNWDTFLTTYDKKDFPLSFTIEEHTNIETKDYYAIIYLNVLKEKIHQSEKYCKSFDEAEEIGKRMLSKFVDDVLQYSKN